jgi:hypothetical protein
MKPGDRVKMSPMWKHNIATGKIIKITREYVVVKWDDVNGEWHYTKDQSRKLEVLDGSD